jgi:hypothetical protein
MVWNKGIFYIAIALRPYLEYAIKGVQVNEEDVKLHFTYQLVVSAADVLVGSVHTIRKNTEDLVVASNEISLEINVNAEKTS